MVGKRPSNLRKGHRAESRGLDALKTFCAVANVPNEEDVGFDAVATLLRREGRSLRAESSFLVQVKAASIRTIDYIGDGYEWLRKLELPLFILSVDVDAGIYELYTTHYAVSKPDGRHMSGATLNLDFVKYSFNDRHMNITLGDPVLRWTDAEIDDDEFAELAYSVLKPFVDHEQRNRSLREIHTAVSAGWQTNQPPTFHGTTLMGSPGDKKRDMDLAVPYLVKLAMHLHGEADDELSLSMLRVLGWLAENDVTSSAGIVAVLLARSQKSKD